MQDYRVQAYFRRNDERKNFLLEDWETDYKDLGMLLFSLLPSSGRDGQQGDLSNLKAKLLDSDKTEPEKKKVEHNRVRQTAQCLCKWVSSLRCEMPGSVSGTTENQGWAVFLWGVRGGHEHKVCGLVYSIHIQSGDSNEMLLFLWTVQPSWEDMFSLCNLPVNPTFTKCHIERNQLLNCRAGQQSNGCITVVTRALPPQADC